MNQTNYKTIVPSIVGAGVLVYESITGHQITSGLQNQVLNTVLTVVGLGFTIFGIIKNHNKGGKQ